MYGEWVVVNLGDGVECKVWVACIPSTPEDVLQRQALNILASRMPKKKDGIRALGDALQAIDDYEYSQGFGTRYEMQKKFDELIANLSND